MPTLDDHLKFLADYVDSFEGCHFIHDDRGWIVWRWGTGRNVELLHLKTRARGRGHGRELIVDMLRKISDSKRPPYATIFGFTRKSNDGAQGFYEAMGFTCTPVLGVYADGEAILFSAPYVDLLEKHGVAQ